MAETGGRVGAVHPPDFGRIEGAAGQWWRQAALLLAHPDFQTLRHPYTDIYARFLPTHKHA